MPWFIVTGCAINTFMEVFFFSLFLPFFSKKAMWMSIASRTQHNCTSNHRMLELEASLESAQDPSPAFCRCGNWSPERLRNFLEVTELVPGRLWAGPLVSQSPEQSAFHYTLSFSSAGKGTAQDRALFPAIRPQPQSQGTCRIPLPRVPWYYWSLL